MKAVFTATVILKPRNFHTAADKIFHIFHATEKEPPRGGIVSTNMDAGFPFPPEQTAPVQFTATLYRPAFPPNPHGDFQPPSGGSSLNLSLISR